MTLKLIMSVVEDFKALGGGGGREAGNYCDLAYAADAAVADQLATLDDVLVPHNVSLSQCLSIIRAIKMVTPKADSERHGQGFSLGARVIFKCLQTLAESESNGKHNTIVGHFERGVAIRAATMVKFQLLMLEIALGNSNPEAFSIKGVYAYP
ncbi:hypothetical protein ACS0TY_033626 [Phlomoides rotata]